MFKISFYTQISTILLTSDGERLLSAKFMGAEFLNGARGEAYQKGHGGLNGAFDGVIERPCPLLKEAKRQFELYFAGRLFEFDLPIKTQGKGFEAKVYQGLREIAYGETMSYKDLAASIGHERAFRAVGNANSKNDLPIIVPCHRVIASSGLLGGYTGGANAQEGLRIKRFLLELEAKNKHKLAKLKL